MKKSLILLVLPLWATSALGEECTPEATQKLGALMTKVTVASHSVDAYKRKYKTDSDQQSDLIIFCLSNQPRQDFKPLFEEAAPAVNDLEEFGNSQTGPCRDSALRASKDLENNVRVIMARFERCKQNQK